MTDRVEKWVADAVAKALPYFAKMRTGGVATISMHEETEQGRKFAVLCAHQEEGDPGYPICIVPLDLRDALNARLAGALRDAGEDVGPVERLNPTH